MPVFSKTSALAEATLLLGLSLTIDSVITIMAVCQSTWESHLIYLFIIFILKNDEPLDTQLNSLLLNFIKGYQRVRKIRSQIHSETRGSLSFKPISFNGRKCLKLATLTQGGSRNSIECQIPSEGPP
jgi:hypothetical protein